MKRRMAEENLTLALPIEIDSKSFLFSAKETFPHINQSTVRKVPAFRGNVSDFLASHHSVLGDEFDIQLKNKVKVCGSCRKCNGYTLNECNGCGGDITTTPCSFSDNIFTCFLFGIEKGPFPYISSIRYESEDLFIFDDLLRLTPCHMNAIPANLYIPDWRYLLLNPAAGKELMVKMREKVIDVTKRQYLSDPVWRKKIFRDSDNLSDDDIVSNFCFGCNFPPSQFQLHLQSILPPYCPFRWFLHMNGNSSMYERFFPSTYIEAVLSCEKVFDVVTEDSPSIKQIIDKFNSMGVSYDKHFDQELACIRKGHAKLCNWHHDDFQYLKHKEYVYTILEGENKATLVKDVTVEQAKEIANGRDLACLSNYGRPFNESNRFTGGYYQFTRATPLPTFS